MALEGSDVGGTGTFNQARGLGINENEEWYIWV
jgi:hypothetical protein